MTKRDILKNGILKYDFETVVQVCGLEFALEWGERTANWSDHYSGGNMYPLTGFPFQVGYKKHLTKTN